MDNREKTPDVGKYKYYIRGHRYEKTKLHTCSGIVARNQGDAGRGENTAGGCRALWVSQQTSGEESA